MKKTDTERLIDIIIASNPRENEKVFDEIRKEKEFAKKLKKARLDLNMDQKTLAMKTGMKQADISRIENGITTPTIKTVTKLLESLGKKLEIVDIN